MECGVLFDEILYVVQNDTSKTPSQTPVPPPLCRIIFSTPSENSFLQLIATCQQVVNTLFPKRLAEVAPPGTLGRPVLLRVPGLDGIQHRPPLAPAVRLVVNPRMDAEARRARETLWGLNPAVRVSAPNGPHGLSCDSPQRLRRPRLLRLRRRRHGEGCSRLGCLALFWMCVWLRWRRRNGWPSRPAGLRRVRRCPKKSLRRSATEGLCTASARPR